MNQTPDYPSMFKMNVAQLRDYLNDRPPITEERLFARKSYEEMLKNLNRRAQAVGCQPEMLEPDYPQLLRLFVQQNVEAEGRIRAVEKIQQYERGRADIQAAISAGVLNVSAPSNDISTEAKKSIATVTFEEALRSYLETKTNEGANADGLKNDELVIRFLLDHFGDIPVNEFDADKARTLDEMLPDIPDRSGIPREHCKSLASRYNYAKVHGWEGLKRLTEARIRNGYHNSLSKFFGWLIQIGLYAHPKPVFRTISGKNLVSLPRDSFEYDEIVKIFSQPLFTGCETPQRIWKPGRYFVQSHLYWGYVLLLLHGLRIGEVGQIHNDDIKERSGIYYIDLRSFDPRQGRVAREDAKRFKTISAERPIPLHPLMIELGLLERRSELRKIGCPVLFPEWEPYPKPGGEMRWGQPITKSWQYMKNKVGIQRADVTAYSSRHWFADFLDSTGISHRGRMTVMGHSTKKDVPAGYGSKSRLSARDLEEIANASSPEIEYMAAKLLKAKMAACAGELTTIKPWLNKANWSKYYSAKFA